METQSAGTNQVLFFRDSQDSDRMLVCVRGDETYFIGSFITHRGWGWWPVEDRNGRIIAWVRSEKSAGAGSCQLAAELLLAANDETTALAA